MKIFNTIFKTLTVHIVNMDFEFIKKNIKIKKIPNLGERIYFEDRQMWDIVDVLHHVEGRHHVIWIVVKVLEDTQSTLLNE